MAVCKFYLGGKCRNGDQCKFSHVSSHAGTNDRKKNLSTQLRGEGQSGTPTGTQRKEMRMLRGVGDQIGIIEITIPEQDAETGEIVKITDYEFLGSYNWKDTIEPIIYVPGCPAKWTPPTEISYQLPKDNEKGYRCPAAPFDPFFQALLHMHPDYNMKPIELITDRNSLRKLLEFASDRQDSWRIDVDLIGDTMFFSQWEVQRIEIINRKQNTGYGHEFEKSFTTFDPELQDSLCHDRIVRYKLGGMNCIVKFEADAYIESEALLTSSTNHDGGEGKTDITLETMMATASIKDNFVTPTSREPHKAKGSPYKLVQVIPQGRLVDPADIAEVKTSVKIARPAKTMPQLWFSQTRNLCIGFHKDGLIEQNVEVQRMETKLTEWETNNQSNLWNMLRVIREIKDMAGNVKAGKCVVIFNQGLKPRSLKVYRRGGLDLVMRAGIKEKFWGGDVNF